MNEPEVRVSRESIRFTSPFDLPQGISVLIDGHLVWAHSPRNPIRATDHVEVRWPREFRPYLEGAATVTVEDSATDQVIFTSDVQFSDTGMRVEIVDARGNWLFLNKWGRLQLPLASRSEVEKRQLLLVTDKIIQEMRSLGYPAFLVGGSLLGAAREGRMLPHDDDVDVAYFTELSSPTELVLEGIKIGCALKALGYKYIRHSYAHIQLIIADGEDREPEHVDLFTCFFQGEFVNQPFHVRGRMSRDQLLPLGELKLEGHRFPVPADPAAWLTVNYDEEWQIPNPGFRLRTPRATARRFQGWFGRFNFHRDFWREYWGRRPLSERSTEAETFADSLPPSAIVVDLGCGMGQDSRYFAGEVEQVFGVDYVGQPEFQYLSSESMDEGNIRWRNVNFNDRLATLEFAQELLSLNSPIYFFGRDFLDGLVGEAKQNVVILLQRVLRKGGLARFFSRASLNPAYRFADPSTWDLRPEIVDDTFKGTSLDYSWELYSREGTDDSIDLSVVSSKEGSVNE